MGTNPVIPFPPEQGAVQPTPSQFGMGQLAGQGVNLDQLQQQSNLMRNAGALDQLKDLNSTLTQAQDFMTTLADQFPGAAQYIRTVVEALDIANRGLVDVLTAVLSQGSTPEPPAPRYVP